MANEEYLKILKQGVEVWNKWREENPDVVPNLMDAYLLYADLTRADLTAAYLYGANLTRANLIRANLRDANLTRAHLSGARLTDARLTRTIFYSTNLTGAYLTDAYLVGANFSHGNLTGVDFTNAVCGYTVFANNDLSEVKGLDSVKHLAPSEISVSTLYKSAGKIPESFLLGCGIPDDFITFIPSLFGVQQAIQFYSCFISYSTKDEEFARRLYSRMRDEKLRVWFAPEDIKGGEKINEQLERAIQLHDRLLLVISKNSLQSEWVMTEIRKARKDEVKEKRRKLFPIRLVDFETIKVWECFDSDTGKDLAVEVREYFIPDFSNWKDHDSFEVAFNRLLRDLKAEEKSGYP